MLLYYYLIGGINCLLVFFNTKFKVNLYDFKKIQVFKISLNIFFKYINSKLIIIIVI